MGSKFINGVNAVEGVVIKIEQWICMALLVVMTLLTTAQVITRYLFHLSILVGIDELINWTFVWLVFIGMGMLLKLGGHIGLEFVRAKMPRSLNKIGTALVDLLLLVMAVLIIKNAVPFVKSQMAILTTSANVPKAYLFAAIPTGMGLMIFHLAVKILNICFGNWSWKDESNSEITVD